MPRPKKVTKVPKNYRAVLARKDTDMVGSEAGKMLKSTRKAVRIFCIQNDMLVSEFWDKAAKYYIDQHKRG